MSRKLQPAHEFKIINSIPRLVRENFRAEFRSGTSTPIIFQDGAAFDVGGDEVTDIPDWAWEAYGKCSDEMKARLKMTPPSVGKK